MNANREDPIEPEIVTQSRQVPKPDTGKSWRAFQKLVCLLCALILGLAPLSGVIEWQGDSAILIRNFEDALSGYLSAASEGKFADIPNTDQYSLRIQTTPGLVNPILRLEKAANALKNWQNRDRARALISRDVWNYNLTNATAAQRAASWKDSDLRPYTPTKPT